MNRATLIVMILLAMNTWNCSTKPDVKQLSGKWKVTEYLDHKTNALPPQIMEHIGKLARATSYEFFGTNEIKKIEALKEIPEIKQGTWKFDQATGIIEMNFDGEYIRDKYLIESIGANEMKWGTETGAFSLLLRKE